MSWGGLNPALTAWRQGINQRFPGRGTGSDGGYADAAHGSDSQHQPDNDGSVDAFDCDVNFLGSRIPAGNPAERRIAEALKRDFQADQHGRGLLWIHQRQIANAEIQHWKRRAYSGDNAHDQHLHYQSRQSKERDGRPWRFIHTDALLREMSEAVMADVTVGAFSAAARAAIRGEATEASIGYSGRGLPSWPGRPENADFLTAFTYLFGQVVDLRAQVEALQGTAAQILEAVVVPEPPAAAAKTGKVKP